MGEKLSVRIRIGDREYPMKVDANDEERIRKAGKLIAEKIKIYREKFGIDEMQDLLAMVAFDSLVDKLDVENNHQSIDEGVFEKINQLNHQISQTLTE